MSAPSFDDLLAAVQLYLSAWTNPTEPDGITEAFNILQEQGSGIAKFTSREREHIYRDAAIREAAERGEPYQEIALRYGLSPSGVSRIAVAAGIYRRGKEAS